MAENYKHLYEQMKRMVEEYQDEIVPGLRKLADSRVEVVRCRECKYRHDSCFAGDVNTYCDLKHTYFPLDGFCSYGERKCNAVN